jgi:hypothetical protein
MRLNEVLEVDGGHTNKGENKAVAGILGFFVVPMSLLHQTGVYQGGYASIR